MKEWKGRNTQTISFTELYGTHQTHSEAINEMNKTNYCVTVSCTIMSYAVGGLDGWMDGWMNISLYIY